MGIRDIILLDLKLIMLILLMPLDSKESRTPEEKFHSSILLKSKWISLKNFAKKKLSI